MPVVPSSQLTPGLALAVILVSGTQALGTAPRRGLIAAPKSTAGTAVVNQVNEAIAGPDAAAELMGPGTQGHLAAVALFKEHPTATVDMIATAAPAGAVATQTVTFDDTVPVTVNRQFPVRIAGRPVDAVWLAGQSEDDAAAAFAILVNQMGNDLPVIAAAVGPVVTLSARYGGVWGNDIAVRGQLVGGAGGAVTIGGAKLVGGATEPVYTTALNNMLGTEYDLIAYVTSNADAAAPTTTSTPSLVNAKIGTRNTGFGTLLQQSVFAHTGAISAVKAGAAQQNIGFSQFVHARNAESLPCEWQGAEMGARLREEAKDPDVNRTNRQDMPYRATLYPSSNQLTDAYTPAELEDLLQSGVSAVIYTAQKVPLISIPRTTYFRDAFNNLDRRLVFVSQPTTLYAVAKDLRSFLPSRFPGAKIIPDLPQTADELPLGVIDESTVRAAVISRLNEAVTAGWIRADRLQAAINDGSLSVKVDPANSSKVNIVLPLSVVPPLTIFDLTILGSL